MGRCLSKNSGVVPATQKYTQRSVENHPQFSVPPRQFEERFDYIDVENLSVEEDIWPDPKEIPSVPFQGERIKVLVYNVYDGDTCSVLVRLSHKNYMKLKIRVNGVDAPELKVRGDTKGTEIGDLEEKAGAYVRGKVKALIEGKECEVRLDKWDKYGGRVNGVIYLSNSKYATLTEYLLARRYAKDYQGQAKEEWTEEELKNILSS